MKNHNNPIGYIDEWEDNLKARYPDPERLEKRKENLEIFSAYS